MGNQVFIINGSGGVGKDAFVQLVNNCVWETCIVGNYSSVSKVKEIAEAIGWDGTKTERNRKFLSDLKMLTTEYNDMPLNDMKRFTSDFMINEYNMPKILFLHIREPQEIAKALYAFKKYNAKAILIKRDSVKQITSNIADGSVYDFDYDIVVNNDGTLEELKEKVECFLNDFIHNTLKNEY